MSISTPEEANKVLNGWLEENKHQVRAIEDEQASFHFEIDYPLGSMKKQRIIQPKEYPGLVVLLNGVGVAEEHKDKLKELSEDDTDTFHNFIRKAFIFAENSYDMNTTDEGVIDQIQLIQHIFLNLLKSKEL